jgi:8-oxo-dGTP pyrophosphatase MutT (NUDIX family)
VYAGPLHYPTLVAHPNGAVVPADEPAVAAARADHLAAHGAAYALAPAAYAHAAYAPAAYAGGYLGGLVAHPNGAVVPVDEPAVQAARADHLAAKAAIGH